MFNIISQFIAFEILIIPDNVLTIAECQGRRRNIMYVAVLKGDIEAKLPGWEVIVGPREAVDLVKFLKTFA